MYMRFLQYARLWCLIRFFEGESLSGEDVAVGGFAQGALGDEL